MVDNERNKRIVESLSCCYNAIGYDVWGDKTPSRAEFEDVVLDNLRSHVEGCDQCDATKEDLDWFLQVASYKTVAELCRKAL